MIFDNKKSAIELLGKHDIIVTDDCDILFPMKGHFISEVHSAIEYLIDEWDFGIKYI